MSTRRGARAVTAVPTAAVQMTHAERTAVTMRAVPTKRPVVKAEVISFPNPWLTEYRNRLLEAAKGAKGANGANGAEGGSDAAAELEALKEEVEALKTQNVKQVGNLKVQQHLREEAELELSSRDELIESLQVELAAAAEAAAAAAAANEKLRREFAELEDQIEANESESEIEDQDDFDIEDKDDFDIEDKLAKNNGLVSNTI